MRRDVFERSGRISAPFSEKCKLHAELPARRACPFTSWLSLHESVTIAEPEYETARGAESIWVCGDVSRTHT